ncbi:hypothetical protein INR77_01210 [Erythrobacter sp. SCSIO 43205]|uniref:hypothetical protein n=1 Tax=Erythrobacter sp. SCSIO 43205 TaxID=2779361 RepID=UPI001CA88F01|nr:hypothetical protein [Erythrobacter sp. SCSIO 43205]UAB78397.1 hypothetical protein INR77_01210 [Erythrobacter sp. SCSIO 43205]
MKKTFAITTALIASVTLAACDVEQTEEGEMPDVDVNVEEGNMPEYEVDGPEVTTDTETVEVPVLEVEPGNVDEEQSQ